MRFLILTVTFLYASSLFAAPLENQQTLTNSYLKQYHKTEHISAVTLTVNSKDQLTTTFSGYTDFSHKHPINQTNLYQIGSITKSFIAAIILQLEATPEYHFSINDELSAYLPEYADWGHVTIKQLLNMTSGIPDYLSDDHFLEDLAANPTKEWAAEEKVGYVSDKPLQFPPGTKWDYSNTNYILAGMIISKLTGHTVAEEMNSRFLAPQNTTHLRLKNTFYISHQYPPAVVSRLVHGYRFGGNIGKYVPLKKDVTQVSLSYAGAAGAIVSNSADITRWMLALLTPNKVLPEKQLTELTTLVSTATGKPLNKPTENDPNGFGLGIGLSDDGSDFPGLVFNYEGMTMGYRAEYIYIPSQQVIVAVTVNSSADDENDHLMALLENAYNGAK